jgi:hypothetical protein
VTPQWWRYVWEEETTSPDRKPEKRKRIYIYTYAMKYNLTTEENEILMDGPGEHHLKRSYLSLERQSSHVFSHMWNIELIQMQAISDLSIIYLQVKY